MVPVLGECPVSMTMKFDGLNSGTAAGRACWMVAGANCLAYRPDSTVSSGCHRCEFYRRVMTEEAGKAQAAFATAAD